MLVIIFVATLLLFASPLIIGFIGMLAPAFAWIPALNMHQPSFLGWQQLSTWPDLSHSIGLTLLSGLGSTTLALWWCYLILRRYWLSTQWQQIERLLAPLLAFPHVAFVLGFGLMFSSTGWLARIWHHLGLADSFYPTLIHDRYGLGLLLVLAIKETPFLLLMSMSILKQLNIKQFYNASVSLGYDHQQTWRMVIVPLWLPKLRLAIFAVAGYGLAVVDIALIIGPTHPSTLSMLIWQWFTDADLTQLPRAAAGALLLLIIVLLCFGLLRCIEWWLLSHSAAWQYSGPIKTLTLHSRNISKTSAIATLFSYGLLLLPLIMLPILALWSFALRWRFPDLLPSRYSVRFWYQQFEPLQQLISNSITLALISSLSALIMAIICLEYRQKHHRGIPTILIAIPMVAPQLSLLFGMQIAVSFIAGQSFWLWVSWSHWLYVFPYIYLTLDGPWRSYDQRLDQTARSLGLSGWQTWWRVKFPQLKPVLLLAFAVGCSVSLAQYLPTQMLGAGRVPTLTTEAVTLASGQDRRVSAIYGLLQGLLPLVFFTLAMVFARRKTSHTQTTKVIL
ncbi:ABC transporter permease [Photobacterium kishitanii]|uniref:Thiamine ABC transporter permease n=1 Tax=Photobacterium kishitanii TaxID=318456 RepID=A0A2T3KIH2_9GAMM|nr:ABC transporter permease subunit [Photobacterium kishitanii]PSU98977.1 thiamine ABC transporter permease [Photobacterium kishitanii]